MNVESAAETSNIAPAKRSANWTVSRALSEWKERIGSIIHGHGRRRRAEADREARVALARGDVLLDDPAGRAEIGMPGGQWARRIRRIGGGGAPLGVGFPRAR